MTSLLTSTALSAIGSFSGNRTMRYILDDKPNLRKFNTHDAIAIGAGAVTPVLISKFVQSSLCKSIGFQGITGLAISSGLTYLLHSKEQDNKKKSVTKIQSHFRKKIAQEKFKDIKFINTTIKQANDDIMYIFGHADYDSDNNTPKYQEAFSEKFNSSKKYLIDKKDVSETADLLHNIREKYQTFKEHYDTLGVDMLDDDNQIKYSVRTKLSDLFIDVLKSIDNSNDEIFRDLMGDIIGKTTLYENKILQELKAKKAFFKKCVDIEPEIQNSFASFSKNANDFVKDIIAIEEGDTEEIFKKRVNKKVKKYSLIFSPDKNLNNRENATKVMAFINAFKDISFKDAKELAKALKK